MSEFRNFIEDWLFLGFRYAVKSWIIEFRWKHDWRKHKEIWLDDLPIELEVEKHSTKINVGRIKWICDVLGIGEWSDFVDDGDWFEGVKMIAQTGFSENDLAMLDVKESFAGSNIKYFLIPSEILEKIRYTDHGCVKFKTTDRNHVPAIVTIHYGRGEVPYWMTKEWLVGRTDPDFMCGFGYSNDPFQTYQKPLVFS